MSTHKDCPVPGCYSKRLVKLSNHLADVHGMKSEERKPWLQEAKIRYKKQSQPSDQLFTNLTSNSMDVRFKVLCNIQIVGPSLCGKSHWTERLLRNLDEMFDKKIEQIVYCYGEFQPRFLIIKKEIPNIQFVEGFPEDVYSLFDKTPGLLILDDLMNESLQKDSMANLATRGCHHRLISTINIMQNMFNKNKHSRTISLNTHYIMAFKNPRDALGVSTLARQAFPKDVGYVMESFEDATKPNFGYLLFDFYPITPNQLRLRTSVFPEDRQVVYVKR